MQGTGRKGAARRLARISALALFVVVSLDSCTIEKAVDYSFYVEEHGDYEINGRCFGIDDQPGERLLITDCGGYLNFLTATVTFGLARSDAETTGIYRLATEHYLGSRYTGCDIDEWRDLGGRFFEVFYHCADLDAAQSSALDAANQ